MKIRKINRRAFLKTSLAMPLIAGAASLSLPRRSSAATELRLLTWEGYAEDAWVKDFEAANNVTVSKTYVGSNDEYMAKLAAGGSGYDLVVIVSSLAQRAIKANFVEAVDPSLIPNIAQLYDRLQRATFDVDGSKLYCVPTFLAISPVTVNAEAIPTGDDFGLLFDPQYKGKIAMWDDVSTIGDVASYMGLDNIWDLPDKDLDAVKAKLLDQKPLIRTYWSQAGEAIDLFTNKEIVATNSWSYITTTLKSQGFPARDFVQARPVGAVDSHFIVKGSSHREIAHKFIDHIIDARSQAKIAEVTGYTPTNPHSKEFMAPDVWKNLNLDQGMTILAKMQFWEDIPRRNKYLEVFNEVKAG
jgi:putative spermidine/putrescine transport system substrate-binding protein/spermidine/putrescine transport system substrate-binding protein